MLVKPEAGTHWYTSDGKPRYGATLREARKELLYPSVTTILQILAKPGLESWKQEQAILAALTLPRRDGEGEDEFAKRVVADSRAQASDAAAVGSEVHAAIENELMGAPWAVEAGLIPVMQLVTEWIAEHLDAGPTEVSGTGTGYGGRIDYIGSLLGTPTIIDFKTQYVRGKKPNTYSTWKYQGAAYRRMANFEKLGLMYLGDFAFANLVVSTDFDNPAIWLIEYTADEMRQAEDAFFKLRDLYYIEKNYFPTLESEAVAS